MTAKIYAVLKGYKDIEAKFSIKYTLGPGWLNFYEVK